MSDQSRPPGPPPRRTDFSHRRWVVILLVGIVLAGVAAGAVFAIGRSSSKPRATGVLVDRPVPLLSLQDRDGRSTSLTALRGKVVVLAPFLTLCHEVCPLTTGAFETMTRAIDRAGLGRKVAFAEVSVDPWRDTPARLRAFSRLTGVRTHLFTGSRAQLTRFWKFFGVASWRTKEGSPPDTDWLTHKPLTFDVKHTDALFLIDASGHERIVHIGMPRPGHLPGVLLRLLNDEGRQDLARPRPGWTIRQGLDDIGYLLGRSIPTPAA